MLIGNEDRLILKQFGVDIIPEDRNYWFVRTQKGTYYEDFKNDEFIGIEWDKVSNIEFIKSANEDDLKVEVNKQYPELERPGYVAAQILKFCNEMKKGDIVLIPSKDSKWITFGEILSDDMYLYEKDQNDFETILDEFYDNAEGNAEATLLMKRRKIRWIKDFKRSDLDPYLYSIIYSHNAIVDANPYSIFIDRMLSQFYIKGDEGYFTYKINRKKNIPYADMLSFLNNNNRVMDYIIKNFPELNFDKDDIIIKVNVQSKGPLQIKSKMVKVLILGLIITALFGSKIKFDFLGANLDLETEGLPKLISTVTDSIIKIEKSKEDDAELKEIIEGLKENKEKLELDVPKSENLSTEDNAENNK